MNTITYTRIYYVTYTCMLQPILLSRCRSMREGGGGDAVVRDLW